MFQNMSAEGLNLVAIAQISSLKCNYADKGQKWNSYKFSVQEQKHEKAIQKHQREQM